MKKVVFCMVFSSILFAAVYAQTATDVIVRSGKQDGAVRVVFESEDEFLKKTNVSPSGMQIKVEFPAAFNIISQKGFDLEYSTKDNLLTISLKEPFETKIMRLTSPPRLVVDIMPSKPVVELKPEIVLPQKTFVIDPGHGGYDSGVIANDLKEKDFTLSLAKEMEDLLIKKDKKVFLTRRSDQFLFIKDRAIFVNKKIPEIFISIHMSLSENFVLYIPKSSNAGSEPSVVELYTFGFQQKRYVKKSRALADKIGQAIKEEFNINIVLREMSLPMLDSVGAPAVLIEVPSSKSMSYDQKTRMRLIEAIIKGFSYYGQ